jgi:hypothetical protein
MNSGGIPLHGRVFGDASMPRRLDRNLFCFLLDQIIKIWIERSAPRKGGESGMQNSLD